MPLTWNAERATCLHGSQSLVFKKAREYLFNDGCKDRCWRQFTANVIFRTFEDALSRALHKREPLVYRQAQTLTCKDELDMFELAVKSPLVCAYARFQKNVPLPFRPLRLWHSVKILLYYPGLRLM